MISHHTGSIMLQLREAARVEYNETIRNGMRNAADEIAIALMKFKDHAIGENLSALNGAWARGCIWLEAARGMPSPPAIRTAVAA